MENIIDENTYIHSSRYDKEYLYFKVNYIKNHTVEELMATEHEFWKDYLEQEEKEEGEFTEEYRNWFIDTQIKFTLEEKEFFDSLSPELVEKYVEKEHYGRKMSSKHIETDIKNFDFVLSKAITDVRYLTEHEYSFKNHMKSKLKEFAKNKYYLGLGISSGIGGSLGMLHPNDDKKIPTAITFFSLALAVQAILLVYRDSKEWFDMINLNQENKELLINAGIYDLLVTAIETKKAFEEQYQLEQGKKRR